MSRSLPQLSQFASEDGATTATLLTGWIRTDEVPFLVKRVRAALGDGPDPEEPARILSALMALPPDEDGLEWELDLDPPVLAHFVPESGLVAVDVLLEGAHEHRLEAVHTAFAASTVDPAVA